MQSSALANLPRRIKPEDLSKALDAKPIRDEVEVVGWRGFPLRLSEGRDREWLTRAVENAIAVTVPVDAGPRSYGTSYFQSRPGNMEIREELEKFAELAHKAWSAIFERSDAVDSRLWDHAFNTWDGEGGIESEDVIVGEPSDYLRFTTATLELVWLEGFLKNAASATKSQGAAWRKAEERELRIQRGQFLAVVFEAAYGENVTINRWPTDARHKSPTPFMHFYQQIVGLILNEARTNDLSGILMEARRRHERDPVKIESFGGPDFHDEDSLG